MPAPGSDISVTFANQTSRFRLDHYWMNIATGPNESADLPTIVFISSAAQLDSSFGGTVPWGGPSPACMFMILMPTLLSGVVRDGLVLLFATLWLLSGHFSAMALKQDGLQRIWQESFRGRKSMRRKNYPRGLHGPM
jgi:hypothetical protein